MRPTEASIPCLCGLAVECIHVVERAELSTVLARLVTAGCELLATLLLPLADGCEACSFDWVRETLEDSRLSCTIIHLVTRLSISSIMIYT